MVKQFYVSDEISRIMPGANDYVFVNLEGIHLQKQLILYNLKEAKHQAFQSLQSYDQKKPCVGWSNWYPCSFVCTIHQNVKLMILCHIDLLLGKDLKTSNETTAIARQQPVRQ
jgi:hypothetical protein